MSEQVHKPIWLYVLVALWFILRPILWLLGKFNRIELVWPISRVIIGIVVGLFGYRVEEIAGKDWAINITKKKQKYFAGI